LEAIKGCLSDNPAHSETDAKVQVGDGTDYAYRARIDREEVVNAIAESVRSIGYSNFKSQVSDHARHDAYLNCWSAMYSFQDQ